MWTILVIITIGIIIEGIRQERKLKHYLENLKEKPLPESANKENAD